MNVRFILVVMVDVDDANTVDIKLFPTRVDPPPVFDYQVPVLTIDFTGAVDKHWDMTIRRIVPFMDGIHSVKMIAHLADVHIEFVRMGVQHLM